MRTSTGWGRRSLLETRSPQVKKLVYVYLVRYAEEQQDLALLSISTFQRGLKVSVSRASLGRGLDDAVLEEWAQDGGWG